MTALACKKNNLIGMALAVIGAVIFMQGCSESDPVYRPSEICELETFSSEERAHACYRAGTNIIPATKQQYQIDRAVNYLDKACQLNHIAACFELGVAYFEEHYEPVDPLKAAQLYKKACSEDLVKSLPTQQACYNLGWMYEHGHGVNQDLEEAKILYEQACNYELSQACHNLAAIMLFEEDSDLVQAMIYEIIACEGDIADACHNVAMGYERAIGLKPDRSKVVLYLTKACELGAEDACNELSDARQRGLISQ